MPTYLGKTINADHYKKIQTQIQNLVTQAENELGPGKAGYDPAKKIEELNKIILENGISDKPIAYSSEDRIASWNMGCGGKWVNVTQPDNKYAGSVDKPTNGGSPDDEKAEKARLDCCAEVIKALRSLKKSGGASCITAIALQEAPKEKDSAFYRTFKSTDFEAFPNPFDPIPGGNIRTAIIGSYLKPKAASVTKDKVNGVIAGYDDINSNEYQITILPDGRVVVDIHFDFSMYKDNAKRQAVKQQRGNLLHELAKLDNVIVVGDSNLNKGFLKKPEGPNKMDTFGIRGAESVDVFISKNMNNEYHKPISMSSDALYHGLQDVLFKPAANAAHDTKRKELLAELAKDVSPDDIRKLLKKYANDTFPTLQKCIIDHKGKIGFVTTYLASKPSGLFLSLREEAKAVLKAAATAPVPDPVPDPADPVPDPADPVPDPADPVPDPADPVPDPDVGVPPPPPPPPVKYEFPKNFSDLIIEEISNAKGEDAELLKTPEDTAFVKTINELAAIKDGNLINNVGYFLDTHYYQFKSLKDTGGGASLASLLKPIEHDYVRIRDAAKEKSKKIHDAAITKSHKIKHAKLVEDIIKEIQSLDEKNDLIKKLAKIKDSEDAKSKICDILWEDKDKLKALKDINKKTLITAFTETPKAGEKVRDAARKVHYKIIIKLTDEIFAPGEKHKVLIKNLAKIKLHKKDGTPRDDTKIANEVRTLLLANMGSLTSVALAEVRTLPLDNLSKFCADVKEKYYVEKAKAFKDIAIRDDDDVLIGIKGTDDKETAKKIREHFHDTYGDTDFLEGHTDSEHRITIKAAIEKRDAAREEKITKAFAASPVFPLLDKHKADLIKTITTAIDARAPGVSPSGVIDKEFAKKFKSVLSMEELDEAIKKALGDKTAAAKFTAAEKIPVLAALREAPILTKLITKEPRLADLLKAADGTKDVTKEKAVVAAVGAAIDKGAPTKEEAEKVIEKLASHFRHAITTEEMKKALTSLGITGLSEEGMKKLIAEHIAEHADVINNIDRRGIESYYDYFKHVDRETSKAALGDRYAMDALPSMETEFNKRRKQLEIYKRALETALDEPPAGPLKDKNLAAIRDKLDDLNEFLEGTKKIEKDGTKTKTPGIMERIEASLIKAKGAKTPGRIYFTTKITTEPAVTKKLDVDGKLTDDSYQNKDDAVNDAKKFLALKDSENDVVLGLRATTRRTSDVTKSFGKTEEDNPTDWFLLKVEAEGKIIPTASVRTCTDTRAESDVYALPEGFKKLKDIPREKNGCPGLAVMEWAEAIVKSHLQILPHSKRSKISFDSNLSPYLNEAISIVCEANKLNYEFVPKKESIFKKIFSSNSKPTEEQVASYKKLLEEKAGHADLPKDVEGKLIERMDKDKETIAAAEAAEIAKAKKIAEAEADKFAAKGGGHISVGFKKI